MKYIILSMISIFSVSVFGQSILNSKSPEELRHLRENRLTISSTGDTVSSEKTPLAYGYIEEKDVLWSKVVWEIIDLNEKLNQPYFYSSEDVASRSSSLFDAILSGVKSGEIEEIYADEFFRTKLPKEEAFAKLQNTVLSNFGKDKLENSEEVGLEDYDTFEVTSDKVRFVKVKGMWYMDKRLGEMRYRLLGLAIMGPDVLYTGQKLKGDDGLIDIFWVWYPSARKTLHNHFVFNPKNASISITFDDLLNARRFSSIIYKTDDGFGREFKDYHPEDSKSQLRQHHEEKGRILSMEGDMWNY
jgi:gliding motility associated protien GldN